MKEKILPIGSVVKLNKDDEYLLMIVNRGALYRESKDVTGYFDYSAVVYPHGIEGSNKFIFFNHEDVSEVVFMGYKNSNEEDFEDRYKEIVESTGLKKLLTKEG